MPPFPPELDIFRVDAGSKIRTFDRDIKSKLNVLSLEVDIADHTECSIKTIRNGYGLWSAAALLVLRLSQEGHHQNACTQIYQK